MVCARDEYCCLDAHWTACQVSHCGQSHFAGGCIHLARSSLNSLPSAHRFLQIYTYIYIYTQLKRINR